MDTRNVKYKITSDAATLPDNGNDNGTDDDPGNPNPYHVNMKDVDTASLAGKWAEIRVVLRHAGYDFYEYVDPTNPTTIFEGVASGNNQSLICGLNVNSSSTAAAKAAKVRYFFIKIVPSTNSQSFNIILMPKRSVGGGIPVEIDTPVIIDPKITNNG